MISAYRKWSLFLLSIPVILTSCNHDDDDVVEPTGIPIPSTYNSANFESNASAELIILDEIDAFVDYLGTANDGAQLDETTAYSLWNGTALKDAAPADFQQIIEEQIDYLVAASAIDPYDWNTAPNNNGGHYENRVFNPYGVESLEFIEKSIFGGVLYHHAYEMYLNFGAGITPAQIDQILAIYGATPVFANTSNSSVGADRHSAKYAARRTPAAGGLYLDIKANFIAARTYAEAGATYNSEKEFALATVFSLWEKVYASTTVNYAYAAIDYLAATNPTSSDIASGMHSYGEAIGFINGVYHLEESYRMISTAQLEPILANMHTPVNQDPTSYQMVTNRVSALADLQLIFDSIQDIYSFSDAEMEAFKINWVNEEGR